MRGTRGRWRGHWVGVRQTCCGDGVGANDGVDHLRRESMVADDAVHLLRDELRLQLFSPLLLPVAWRNTKTPHAEVELDVSRAHITKHIILGYSNKLIIIIIIIFILAQELASINNTTKIVASYFTHIRIQNLDVLRECHTTMAKFKHCMLKHAFFGKWYAFRKLSSLSSYQPCKKSCCVSFLYKYPGNYATVHMFSIAND